MAQNHEIAAEMRSLVIWHWGHLTAEHLIALTRQAFTPSEEQVREVLGELISSGELVVPDDERRFILGEPGDVFAIAQAKRSAAARYPEGSKLRELAEQGLVTPARQRDPEAVKAMREMVRAAAEQDEAG